MALLVLPPRFTPDSQAISDAAAAAGWTPLRLTSWRPPEGLQPAEVVIYGEPLFVSVVAEPLGIAPLSPPAAWVASLDAHFLQREIRYTTLAEARQIRAPTFVKPALDKSFPARVFPSAAELPGDDAADPRTPVLLSEPVRWEVELRFFVADGEIVTGSPYMARGALARSEDGEWVAAPSDFDEGRTFAREALRATEGTLPPGVVLDVGRIEGRGWAVVEANAAWGSGLYGCDPSRALEAIRRSCIPRSAVTPETAAWACDPVWRPD